MSIFTNLFKKSKTTKELSDLGIFTFFKDNTDEYWEIETPIGNLPEKFDFGAINGDLNGPNVDAEFIFRKISKEPNILTNYLNEIFLDKLNKEFGSMTIPEFQEAFYLKSLTCSSKDKFEFGFHSLKDDIFIESFVRNNAVTEVYVDKGCCEHV